MSTTENEQAPARETSTRSGGNGATAASASGAGDGILGRVVASTSQLTVDSITVARTATFEAMEVADAVAFAGLDEFERVAREIRPVLPLAEIPLKTTRMALERGSAGVRHLLALV